MLERIPDFNYFTTHSFIVRTDEGGNDVTTRRMSLHPAINDCQILKMRSQSTNNLPNVVHTDLTIEHGSVTKKSYVKPKTYKLEGRHKVVYSDGASDTSVVVRTDKYPLLWVYYWVVFRTITSAAIARKILASVGQQWRFEIAWTWRSLSGLLVMTRDSFKQMAASISKEWT